MRRDVVTTPYLTIRTFAHMMPFPRRSNRRCVMRHDIRLPDPGGVGGQLTITDRDFVGPDDAKMTTLRREP